MLFRSQAATQRRSRGGIGSPRRVREWCARYEAAGIDQLMFLLPPVSSELILESIELMGRKVIPEFHERDDEVAAAKAKRLEPVLEQIESRRVDDAPPLDPEYEFGGVPEAWDRSSRADEVELAMAQAAALAQEQAAAGTNAGG